MEKIKLLLSLRAWIKSRTLNFAGILGAIAAWDLTTGGGTIQMIVDFLTNAFGWMEGTALAALVALKSLADVILRAKTDKSLQDK